MVLDMSSNGVQLTAEQIRHFSDRHFGVGFDQLLQIEKASSDDVDFDYRIFNSDGDEVEHCGNGARCFAKYVHDKKLSTKNPLRVKTQNRILSLLRLENGDVTVDMESPVFECADIPFVANTESDVYSRAISIGGEVLNLEFSALSVGNPHAVVRVDSVEDAPVEEIGRALGSHKDFPEGVNVGFMQILDRSTINLRVYERGAGETLACGTGACAAVVAGCRLGLLDDTVRVILKGGELSINWQQNNTAILMTGPAETAYEGTINL